MPSQGLGSAAARSGNLEMVKFIEQYNPLDQADMTYVAMGGSIEVLQYYVDKGFNIPDTICEAAAKAGHKDFLRFALSLGAPMSNYLMEAIADMNDVDMVKEVRAKGCK